MNDRSVSAVITAAVGFESVTVPVTASTATTVVPPAMPGPATSAPTPGRLIRPAATRTVVLPKGVGAAVASTRLAGLPAGICTDPMNGSSLPIDPLERSSKSAP